MEHIVRCCLNPLRTQTIKDNLLKNIKNEFHTFDTSLEHVMFRLYLPRIEYIVPGRHTLLRYVYVSGLWYMYILYKNSSSFEWDHPFNLKGGGGDMGFFGWEGGGVGFCQQM